MNPDVRIEAIAETISENNVSKLIADCDLIVDALDNFPTRYLLNKTALEKNIPFCHGAVYGFEGRASEGLTEVHAYVAGRGDFLFPRGTNKLI